MKNKENVKSEESTESAVKRFVMPDDLRMRAYYYGFEKTGVRVIDEILSAVAKAGKGCHHTEYWGDTDGKEFSYIDLIQEMANRAAANIILKT